MDFNALDPGLDNLALGCSSKPLMAYELLRLSRDIGRATSHIGLECVIVMVKISKHIQDIASLKELCGLPNINIIPMESLAGLRALDLQIFTDVSSTIMIDYLHMVFATVKRIHFSDII
jgi:hypothetical protein